MAKKSLPETAVFIVTGTTTVACFTRVRATSPAEALEIATERGPTFKSGANPFEEFIIETADGEIENFAVTDQDGETLLAAPAELTEEERVLIEALDQFVENLNDMLETTAERSPKLEKQLKVAQDMLDALNAKRAARSETSR